VARELYDNARSAAGRDHRQSLADRQSRLRILAGRRRRGRHRPVHRRARAARSAHGCTRCGSSGSAKARTASAHWPTTSRRSIPAARTTWAFRGDGRRGHRRTVRPLRRRTRRLRLDHGQSAGGPVGRSLCRVPARAGTDRLGPRTRAAAHYRGTDRRALPGHPPRAWLPRAARPHRETDPVRPARSRTKRGRHA
jgi:hypothetical protein